MKILKYTLRLADYQEIPMPAGARLLCVQIQAGAPQLWALVDPASPIEQRPIWVHGTDHEAHGAAAHAYVGTFQMHGGGLVFHVFG